MEQHITINAEGRVWFYAYNFGSGFGEHEKARSKIFKIEKNAATKVLNAIAHYFGNDHMEWFVTDIGDWCMEITNTEGVVYKFRGSLCCDIEVDGVDLSDMVRDALGMDDLYVFDGNHKPDRVDRLTVDYHRVTKMIPKQPLADAAEYVTWDYTDDDDIYTGSFQNGIVDVIDTVDPNGNNSYVIAYNEDKSAWLYRQEDRLDNLNGIIGFN